MTTKNVSEHLRRCYFRNSSQLSCLNKWQEVWEKLNVNKKQDQAWIYCVSCVALCNAAGIELSMLVVRSVAGLYVPRLVYKADGATPLAQAMSPSYGLYVKDGIQLALGKGRFSHLRAGYCTHVVEHADVFYDMATDAMLRAYKNTEEEGVKKTAIEGVDVDAFKREIEQMMAS